MPVNLDLVRSALDAGISPIDRNAYAKVLAALDYMVSSGQLRKTSVITVEELQNALRECSNEWESCAIADYEEEMA